MSQITVKEYVAEKLMVEAGWPLEERENNAEWDADLPDSQYRIMLDLAESAIQYTLEAMDLLDQAHHEEQFPPLNPENGENVKSSSTTYLFLDNEKKTVTVGDARDWLAEVNEIGVPDHFAVEGYLHLMFDESLQLISKDHPSVISRTDAEVRQLELDTARKKIDHLIKEGQYQEAERVLEFVRKKEESLDS